VFGAVMVVFEREGYQPLHSRLVQEQEQAVRVQESKKGKDAGCGEETKNGNRRKGKSVPIRNLGGGVSRI